MSTTSGNTFPSRRSRAARAAAAAAAAALVLSGCGDSATSTDEVTDTSIAPLPRDDQQSTASGTPSAAATETTGTDDGIPAAAKVRRPADYAPEDQGAKEITAIPSFAPSHTTGDETYLAALAAAGISVDGIEDQLIGAGVEVCRTRAAGIRDVTLPAVAGQLVEQQRTRLNAEETSNAIASAASAAYCRTP